MMQHEKYFKSGQKLLLKSLDGGDNSLRFEAATVYLRDCGPGYFDLALPYRIRPGETLPFSPGTSFELLSETLGLGLRITGTFHSQRGDNVVRLTIGQDLQVFQRRQAARLDTVIGLRYNKAKGTLKAFREQWEKNVAFLAKNPPAQSLPVLARHQVNLSESGIRFYIEGPTRPADLCLLLLQPNPDETPICTVAEVIWVGAANDAGQILAGLQFISILETDRARILRHIKDQQRAGKAA